MAKSKAPILVNSFNDKYTLEPIYPPFQEDKAANVALWDTLDEIAEETIKKFAAQIGIQITEMGDFDDIKEVVELVHQMVEKRFGVTYPFVDCEF